MIYMFLSNNPSSGDKNLSNLSCCYSAIFTFLKIKAFKQQILFTFRMQVIKVNTKVIESV